MGQQLISSFLQAGQQEKPVQNVNQDLFIYLLFSDDRYRIVKRHTPLELFPSYSASIVPSSVQLCARSLANFSFTHTIHLRRARGAYTALCFSQSVLNTLYMMTVFEHQMLQKDTNLSGRVSCHLSVQNLSKRQQKGWQNRGSLLFVPKSMPCMHACV